MNTFLFHIFIVISLSVLTICLVCCKVILKFHYKTIYWYGKYIVRSALYFATHDKRNSLPRELELVYAT